MCIELNSKPKERNREKKRDILKSIIYNKFEL